MAPLTSDRNTIAREGDTRSGLVAADVRIFAGALIMRTATGHLAPGATVATAIGAGRADIGADNTGGSAGDIAVDWRRGTFRFENSAGGDTITAADIGHLCYIVDDCTVARTDDSAARSPAGVVEDVTGADVWVRMDEALTRAMVTV